MTKPKVNLTTEDGNAFAILGRCKRASTRAGWTGKEWKEFEEEAMSGDYDTLLQAVLKYFEVQ